MHRKTYLASGVLAPLLVSAAAAPMATSPGAASIPGALSIYPVNPSTSAVHTTHTPLHKPFIVHASPAPRPFRHIRRQDLALIDGDTLVEGEAVGVGSSPALADDPPAPTVSFDDGMWHPSVSDTSGTTAEGDLITMNDEEVVTILQDTAISTDSVLASSTVSTVTSGSTSSTASVFVKEARPTAVSSRGGLITGSRVPVECAQGCADTFAHIK